ncbi:MAG: M20/M25/M40 family metallo-hydrolase [Hyphomonadaceae bacterium]
MVRKLLIGVALLVVALIGVVVVRALMFGPTSPQPEVIPVAQIEFDLDAAAARLGQAVRYPTVSLTGAESDDRAAFDAMHRWMAETYPAFHAVAQRETVSELSLVYTWEGSDPSLQPILLLAHQDVVPVADDTRSAWTADPFGGEVRDGAVWGRGTLDDKGSMVALLEAAEYLAARGVRPTRTIILAFGHDEEIGGGEGAARIAALLAERGVRAWFVLDEGGGAIAENPLTGRPAAMIGITERGSGTMTVRAVGQPGHSSLPPEDTAVSLVSRAVVRIHGMSLERNFASGPVMEMMHALSPDLSFPAKAAFANEWLSGPLLHAEAGKTAPGRALMGTTIAPTMIDGGVRANVLPAEATATLNFRIHPRDNADELLRRAQRP